MNYTIDIVIGSVLIIILNLWLKSFVPPLKPQYHAGVLLVISALIAHFIFGNFAYGIALGGLVYFKDELLAELRYVLDILRPKMTNNNNNNNNNNNDDDKTIKQE